MLALAGLALAVEQSGGMGDPRVQDVEIDSRALDGSIRAAIVLPADYATSGKRYPVITFLHGLPAAPFAYRGVGFLQRALDSLGGEAIVVAPQGARDGDDDPEYHDWGPGRNWETAIGVELRRYVDSHYRTIPNRRARAIVGLSAGGYGAMLVALHNLQAFGVVESWSGYFTPTDPSGTRTLDLGSREANRRASAHALVVALRADQRRRPTFVAFYVGRGDERFREENVLLHRELDAAGVKHTFQIVPGGHSAAVWQAHAPDWLRLALRQMTRARAAPPR